MVHRERTLAGRTIVLIDDDRESLELLDFVLKKQHCRTFLAGKGEEGLALIRRHKPDLILLDVILPDLHGAVLCRRLKADPATREIPVLFLSAMVAEKEIEAGYRAGAAGYLFKPFENEQVLEKIEEILKARPEARERP